MKKLFIALTAIAFSAGAFAQVKSDDIAKITEETINLGKIPQGIPAVSTFVVTNIGKTDLIIESANPTCGCTVSDYTKTPIKPGQTGKINATFNAAAVGPIDKHMNVKFAGAEDTKSIGFKGEVLTTEDYAKLKGTAAPTAAVSTSVDVKTTVPAAKTVKKAMTTKKAKSTKTTAVSSK